MDVSDYEQRIEGKPYETHKYSLGFQNGAVSEPIQRFGKYIWNSSPEIV